MSSPSTHSSPTYHHQPPPIFDGKSFPFDLNQNPFNPFYIHPSEGHFTVVIAPLLMDNNYYSWSRSFCMAMVSKNKMTFILGSILVPPLFDPLYSY